MKLKKLEAHIIDSVQEAHAKLGFDCAPMTQNYTLSTLNGILGTKMTNSEMNSCLEGFCEELSQKIGLVNLSSKGDVFCITLSPEARKYVRDNTKISDFLAEFISAVGARQPVDSILGIFRKYSDRAHIEQVENDEFDYLAYFEDGIPDEYYYCLTVEGPMVSYHRFRREDYMAFGF